MIRFPLLLVCLLALAACGEEGGDTAKTKAAAAGGDAQAEAGPTGEEAEAPVRIVFDRDQWPAADVRRLKPGHEPTPYSAEQLRLALGREATRVMHFAPTGRDAWHRCWTWENADALGATLRDAACDAQGKENGDVKHRQVTWHELQSHASWPADTVVAGEETITTPAGTFDCMRYVVTRETKRGTAEDRYWFAWGLPGPPVRLERRVGGTLEFTMTLAKAEGPGAR